MTTADVGLLIALTLVILVGALIYLLHRDGPSHD